MFRLAQLSVWKTNVCHQIIQSLKVEKKLYFIKDQTRDVTDNVYKGKETNRSVADKYLTIEARDSLCDILVADNQLTALSPPPFIILGAAKTNAHTILRLVKHDRPIWPLDCEMWSYQLHYDDDKDCRT